MFNLGEARPDSSGALFLFSQKRKKRERKADKGAQINILSWSVCKLECFLLPFFFCL